VKILKKSENFEKKVKILKKSENFEKKVKKVKILFLVAF
jgi:hypothetical protein